MSSETLVTGAIGWFGKLPAAGDFLRRGLPDHFVDNWDAWLQAGMAAASQAHGDDWQENFLRFPVWFFLRGLSTAEGETEQLWAGLLVPSVDRVGRLFPLTVAFSMSSATLAGLDMAMVERRLGEIEACTLGVLGDDDLDGFERALGELPPLEVVAVTGLSPLTAFIKQLGQQTLQERLAGHALFWTADTSMANEMLVLPEPLQADAFGQLVLPTFSSMLSD